ncbi:serine/threonine-protein kinase brsk2-like protein [Anaeramoeba ignava]|uniref:Serine/threonine-protein kinase brsk2-like protein n=1 Tax=Anaeramoeba ignava TaxID=1746090 RepID=A0A9Q0LWB4_ANAIG|nr:serine/threonine-protein kinase brsk2-like protein [Anaeramoeba ignava]
MSNKIGNYIIGKTLGIGSTGKVKLGIEEETEEKVAIKIISKKEIKTKKNALIKIEREIAILKLLSHPHVLKLHDVYESSSHLYLVMEHLEGGELFDYLITKGILPDQQALFFFQQIIFGLDYCHKHFVCHRDLKPENLLLDKNNYIKIADFGMARLTKRQNLLVTSCGSPHYASPEVILGIKYNGMKADIWSCGVILFALLAGSLPFDDPHVHRLLQKVKSGIYSIPKSFTKLQKDLIQKMLVVDPTKRISLNEIKKHPWFTSNYAILYKEPQPMGVMDEFKTPILIENIDREILYSLKSLGYSDLQQISQDLIQKEMNITKVFYLLLQRKKQESNPKNISQSNSNQDFKPNGKTTLSQERPLFTELNLLPNMENLSQKTISQESDDKAAKSISEFSSHSQDNFFEEDLFFLELEDPKKPKGNQNQNLNQNQNQNQNQNLNQNQNQIENENISFIEIKFDDQEQNIIQLNQEKKNKNNNSKKNSSLPMNISLTESNNKTNNQTSQFGTPRFHRYKLQQNLESSPSPPKGSESPKKGWFGSWFNRFKKSNGNKKKISKKQQKLNERIAKIPKEVVVEKNTSFFHLLTMIQQSLNSLSFNWIHPHEFLFLVSNQYLRFKIKIKENTSSNNRSDCLFHSFIIIWKNGDLLKFEKTCSNLIRLISKFK